MVGSPVSKEGAIVLLKEQVITRNALILRKHQAMTKAINMLKAGDCLNSDVINILVDGM